MRIALSSITWPLRLSVRTSGFHPGKRGSTPLGATKKSCEALVKQQIAALLLFKVVLFAFPFFLKIINVLYLNFDMP